MAFKWNPRKLNFCFIYARNGGNGTDAYRESGYKSDRPGEGASRLLKIIEIQEQVERCRKENLLAHGVTEDRVKAELIEMAGVAFDSDYAVTDMFEHVDGAVVGETSEGKPVKGPGKLVMKHLDDIPRGLLKMIKSIRTTFSNDGEQNVAIELYDRVKLLTTLGQDLGMFQGDSVGINAEDYAKEVQTYLNLMEEADGAKQDEQSHTTH